MKVLLILLLVIHYIGLLITLIFTNNKGVFGFEVQVILQQIIQCLESLKWN